MNAAQEARDGDAIPHLQRRRVLADEIGQERHVGLDLRGQREEGERAGGAEREGNCRDFRGGIRGRT